MKREEKSLSRRSFLKGGLATLGLVAGTLLSGCKNPNDHLIPPKEAEKGKERPITADWLGTPPDIPENQIKDTAEADVVIVGAGVAGINAARAAAEAGASVIVVEKAATWQFRSGQYGTIGNRYQRELGIAFDKNKAINETMKQMGYRADQRAWNVWAENSGRDFDWMLDAAPAVHLLKETDSTLERDKVNLMFMHYPTPPEYDRESEFNPTYPTVMTLIPSQKQLLSYVVQKCEGLGVKFIYSTKGVKLLRPNMEHKGRVEGLIGQDVNGGYHRYNARRAVILTTGDYGNNPAMLKCFIPAALNYFNVFPNRDAKNLPTNTGDGHIMGAWVGGKIEDGPHTPNNHTLGGPLGVDAFLLVNGRGQRFLNEDASGSQLTNGLLRQPGNFAWQVFDDKWPEQLPFMGVSHGSVNHCVPAVENPKLPPDCQWAIGRTSYTSREDLLQTPNLVMADTIEELAAKLFPGSQKARQTFLATIKRYNASADNHYDEEFGKHPKRLFPVRTAPFYAGKMEAGAMLVTHGGFVVDPLTANVLDMDYDPIPGLYAAGNVQGGRFLVDYPVVTAGVSHAFALVYGRLAGTQAAKCNPEEIMQAMRS